MGLGYGAKGIAREALDFQNIADGNLDMADYHIYMGTGAIGNNDEILTFATGATGLATFTGGITTGTGNVTLGTGNLYIGANGIGMDAAVITIATGASGLVTFTGGLLVGGDIDMNGSDIVGDADGNSKISFGTDDRIMFTIAGTDEYRLDASMLRGATGGSGAIVNKVSSNINPTMIPRTGGISTGMGSSGNNTDLSAIVNSLESQRWIAAADTDSDNTDVLATGVSGFHGFVLVRSITDNTSAMYRVTNVSVVDVSLDGDHTSTKDTGSHYNFYYDTDQFKLQNSVGDNKSVSVVFWVLPT